jgi:PPOX class probable F420-dependent enzyme
MESKLTPEALEILSGRHVAVLSTLVRGGPALACVWYGFDAGDLIVSTPAGRRKDRNVRDDPRVALLVDVRGLEHTASGLGYRGVEVRGRAAIEDDPGAVLRRAILQRYLDPVPPEYEARILQDDRCIIRITPERVRTWDYTRGR